MYFSAVAHQAASCAAHEGTAGIGGRSRAALFSALKLATPPHPADGRGRGRGWGRGRGRGRVQGRWECVDVVKKVNLIYFIFSHQGSGIRSVRGIKSYEMTRLVAGPDFGSEGLGFRV
jgi:hypothetical protein